MNNDPVNLSDVSSKFPKAKSTRKEMGMATIVAIFIVIGDVINTPIFKNKLKRKAVRALRMKKSQTLPLDGHSNGSKSV
jgi:hypothetical protein